MWETESDICFFFNYLAQRILLSFFFFWLGGEVREEKGIETNHCDLSCLFFITIVIIVLGHLQVVIPPSHPPWTTFSDSGID